MPESGRRVNVAIVVLGSGGRMPPSPIPSSSRRHWRISRSVENSMRWIASLVLVAALAGGAGAQTTYDLVIANGRVMDPASGLDAVRHVGITGRKIATISATPLKGKRVIDAKNNVVAPGFIDLHEHGQNEESYGMMVRDGVTTALEIEVGVADIPKFYADRASGQIVNYGASVGHIPARMKVLHDPSTNILPAGVGGTGKATEAQIAQMEAILRKGLADGAVAVGLGSAYTPGASMNEIQRMFKVAAQGNASAHIHMRNGVAGLASTF